MKFRDAILASLLVFTSACIPQVLGQGDLLPPPGPPGPTMRTLEELWDKIDGLEVRATALETQNTILQSQSTLLQRQLGLLTASTVNFAWVTSRIADGNGLRYSSLAFGPDGQPAVAFASNSVIQFARYDGTTWTVTALPGPAGSQPSLAFGPDGQPAIAYSGAISAVGTTQFARFDGSVWSVTEVDSGNLGVRDPSLAFGSDGLPGIAYLRGIFELRYALFNGTDWILSGIFDSNIDLDIDSAIGPDGVPVIAYHTFNGGAGATVKVARVIGPQWAVSTAATDSAGSGTTVAACFGPDGQPAIAYADNRTQRIFVTRYNGIAWTPSLVTIGTGLYLSLRFGFDGQPALAYQNDTSDLIFSRCLGDLDGPAWKATVVDAAGLVGANCSLAFGPDGQPAIAYEASSGGNDTRLKIARKGAFPSAL